MEIDKVKQILKEVLAEFPDRVPRLPLLWSVEIGIRRAYKEIDPDDEDNLNRLGLLLMETE